MNINSLHLLLTNKEDDNYKDGLFMPSNKIEELDYTIASWLMKECQQRGAKTLYLGGGEPLQYSHIRELIGEARELGYLIEIETSGKNFLRNTSWLREAGVKRINIPFLGTTAEVHDFIRGQYSYWENLAAAEVARNYGFELGIRYIFGRHNFFEAEEAIEFITSLSPDYSLMREVLPFGRAFANELDLTAREAQSYYYFLREKLQQSGIQFSFNYGGPPYGGDWACGSLQGKIMACNWKNQVGYCRSFIHGRVSCTLDKNHLDNHQFNVIEGTLDMEIEKFWKDNPQWKDGCEPCLTNFRRQNYSSIENKRKHQLSLSRHHAELTYRQINTLEVDLTNQGSLNDIFYKDSERRFLDMGELYTFFEKTLSQMPINNVLLRGMGEPINHPKFFECVSYFSKQGIRVNIFTVPEKVNEYIMNLILLTPGVSLSVQHYPNDNYSTTLSQLEQFNHKVAGHYFIVDNQSFAQISTFLEYARVNKFSPYFIRVMSNNSKLDSSLKEKVENIIRQNNLHKNIFWENGRDFNCQCSYLRGQRMFVNSCGNISFCHFLPQLEKSQLSLVEAGKNFGKIMEIYQKFKHGKENICRRKDYCFDIESPSPCDYCYRYNI